MQQCLLLHLPGHNEVSNFATETFAEPYPFKGEIAKTLFRGAMTPDEMMNKQKDDLPGQGPLLNSSSAKYVNDPQST